MKGNRTGKGYYTVQGKEPLAKAIGLRLPQSIDQQLREELNLSGSALLDFIRAAVAEKLERDMKAN